MIDSHSHIYDEAFKEDYFETINRAKIAGVKKIILVGFSEYTNLISYNEMLKHQGFLYSTSGIHPSEVDKKYKNKLINLEKFIHEHKTYAIGECGLDYHYDITYKEEQKLCFIEQIKLAIKYDLPIIVHSRDAINDTYEILKEFKGQVRGVMHCFSSSYEMALKFIELGFYISLGGPVTFKNAKEPKKVATLIPVESLLIETDSPYLAPTPYRGKRNESSYLPLILEEISKLRNIDIKELETIIDNNTLKLFKLED